MINRNVNGLELLRGNGIKATVFFAISIPNHDAPPLQMIISTVFSFACSGPSVFCSTYILRSAWSYSELHSCSFPSAVPQAVLTVNARA